MDSGGKTDPLKPWREQLTEADRQILVFAVEQGIKSIPPGPDYARWIQLYESTLKKLMPDFHSRHD